MFISKDFTFDGTSNSTYGVISVQVDADTGLTEMGIAYSKDVELDEGKFPTFTENNSEPQEIILQLMLVDENMKPIAWTDNKVIEVKNWLITDSFKPFISNDNRDYIYYFKCTNITKRFLPSRKGILEVTFKPYSHYAYKQLHLTEVIEVEKTISITNPSKDDYYPIIKVNNFNPHIVLNINDFNFMHSENEAKTVIIDMFMKTITDEEGNVINAETNSNWVKLTKGLNRLRIECVGEIEIFAEFPILL